MENHKTLSNHRAVVTGASSGIGRAYARQLAALGADLVIAARRRDKLEALASEIRLTSQVRVQVITIDLSEPDAAKSLFEQAISMGPVTILINNAGIARYGSFLDFSLQDQRATLELNAIRPTEITYWFAQHMLKHQKTSYLVQVASIAAFQPVGNFSVYSASKTYLRVFSETLAFELRGTPIHVLCCCPGGTYTEFFEHSGQKITQSGHKTMMSAEKVAQLSLRAMLKRKTVYVPGLLNQIACFLPRLLPRKLALFLAFLTMNRAVQRVAPTQTAPTQLE